MKMLSYPKKNKKMFVVVRFLWNYKEELNSKKI